MFEYLVGTSNSIQKNIYVPTSHHYGPLIWSAIKTRSTSLLHNTYHYEHILFVFIHKFSTNNKVINRTTTYDAVELNLFNLFLWPFKILTITFYIIDDIYKKYINVVFLYFEVAIYFRFD